MTTPAPLPCSAHCHHGTVPTYTRSPATFTSDGLGPTVDAPCLRCRGTGSEPCGVCGDAAATSRIAGRAVCNDCAPSVRQSAAEAPKLTGPQWRTLRSIEASPLLTQMRRRDGRRRTDAPSLRPLQRAGLIEPRQPVGTGWQLTPAGRAALEASR